LFGYSRRSRGGDNLGDHAGHRITEAGGAGKLPVGNNAAMTEAQERVVFFGRALRLSGHPVHREAKVLDFGCGDGALVRAYADAGFDAYGCDIVLGQPSERLRLIENPYRLPFDDHTFDVAVSDQVFEHVDNYPAVLRELRRVLHPDGVSFNIFPPRFRMREVHVFVPFASMIQNYPWLRLWAAVGIRNQFQQGKSAEEVTQLNLAFLRDHTTYLTRRDLLREARAVFPGTRLAEKEMLTAGAGTKRALVARLAKRIPIIATLYCETRMRGLLLRGNTIAPGPEA
jgi:SAM-dependent methyltransferase